MAKKRNDDELTLSADITRRDFLNASLIGAGATLLAMSAPREIFAQSSSTFDGPSGIGDYANSNGNTQAVLKVGHDLRDGKYDPSRVKAEDTGDTYDLVIAGGGISGLSAAFEFKKNNGKNRKCLVLENHPIFGGEAKQNEFMVNGQRLVGPQGSNGTAVVGGQMPRRNSEVDVDGDFHGMSSAIYEAQKDLEMPTHFDFQEWDKNLKPLEFPKENYEFYLWSDRSPNLGYFFDGHGWVHDMWTNDLKDTPFRDDVKRDLLIWRTSRKKYYEGKDLPRYLDSITYKHYIEKVMGLSPEVTRYVDPIIASSIGPCADATSAYVAYRIGLPGFLANGMGDSAGSNMAQNPVFSFPGGNAGVARYYVKALVPDGIAGDRSLDNVINGRVDFKALDRPGSDVRIRLASTVIGVTHSGKAANAESVLVTYVKDGRVYRVKARSVVMAGGSWTTKHVVSDLPDNYRAAYQQFYRSPMLVVNVALTNWRFMYELGVTACRWFQGFGFTCNIRRPMIAGSYQAPLHPDKPIIMTFYVPFYYPGLSTREQGMKGRYELLSTSYAEYERKIVEQMTRLFSKGGFNAKRDIGGIILNRWGHAYVDAQPGFFYPTDGSPAPRDIIRKRFGRIAFAHSELMGTQHWPGAAAEGIRAARQVLEII